MQMAVYRALCLLFALVFISSAFGFKESTNVLHHQRDPEASLELIGNLLRIMNSSDSSRSFYEQCVGLKSTNKGFCRQLRRAFDERRKLELQVDEELRKMGFDLCEPATHSSKLVSKVFKHPFKAAGRLFSGCASVPSSSKKLNSEEKVLAFKQFQETKLPKLMTRAIAKSVPLNSETLRTLKAFNQAFTGISEAQSENGGLELENLRKSVEQPSSPAFDGKVLLRKRSLGSSVRDIGRAIGRAVRALFVFIGNMFHLVVAKLVDTLRFIVEFVFGLASSVVSFVLVVLYEILSFPINLIQRIFG